MAKSLSAVVMTALLAISGCTGRLEREKIDVAPVLPENKYAVTDLSDLVDFSGAIAEVSPADRLTQCRELLQLSKKDPHLGVRLHLLLAQSVPESCGSPGEAAALINTALAEVGDRRLKSFLVYQRAILIWLDREIGRRKALERRVSRVITKEQKAHRRLQSQQGELRLQQKKQEDELRSLQERKEDELRMLQEKLDALKHIEQSLDESKSGK